MTTAVAAEFLSPENRSRPRNATASPSSKEGNWYARNLEFFFSFASHRRPFDEGAMIPCISFVGERAFGKDSLSRELAKADANGNARRGFA